MWSFASALPFYIDCQISEVLLLPHFRSAFIRKDVNLRFRTTHPCLVFKICEVSLPHFHSVLIAKDLKFRFFPHFRPAFIRKDVKLCLHTSGLSWLPKLCSLGSAVYSYMYFHTTACCLTWRISPSERRGILIRTQKSKQSSNWFYCWSSSKDFICIQYVRLKCNVASTWKVHTETLTFRANGYRLKNYTHIYVVVLTKCLL